MPRSPNTEILREGALNRKEGEGEWATVDWLTENKKVDAAKIRRHNSHNNTSGRDSVKVRNVFSSSQGFLSAVAIGLALGALSIFSEASTHFIVSLRVGICARYFWLGREQCCVGDADEHCDGFYTWSEFFGTNPRNRHFTDYLFHIFFTCIFAMSAAVFCKFYNAFSVGGGINEVKTIVSGHTKSRYLGGWTLATKVMATCLTTGCGVLVGKEGPFVHIGASVGYILSSLFPDYSHHETRRRELIVAGCAAGIAVAFGAPIGGVLFALEEISSTYTFKALMQSLIAGVVAVLVVRKVDMFHTGRIVQFSINYNYQWHWFELPLFAIVGCVGGFIGALYNVCNMKWCAVRKANFKEWKILELGVLGFLSGTFNFIVPYCQISVIDLLGDLFQECTPGSTLEFCRDSDFAAMIYFIIGGCYKIILSCLTVGCFVPTGYLVPCMCVGALLGRAFGLFITAVQQTWPSSFLFTECFQQDQCIAPGAYAMIGAAAVLCGITRMTICLAVIMFELTGSVEYLVPVVIGILCAKSTGDALGEESIFELGIEANNFPYLDPKKEFLHEGYAYDIYERSPKTKKARKWHVVKSRGMTISDLNDLLEASHCTGFPVVSGGKEEDGNDNHDNDKRTLLGYITAANLKRAMSETATRRDSNVTSQTRVRFCGGDEKDDDHQQAVVEFGALDHPLAHRHHHSSDETKTTTHRSSSASPFELDYTDFVDASVLQVDPNSTVQFLLTLFKSLGIKKVIVSKYSKFIAVLTKKDLIDYMRRVEREEHQLIHDLEVAMKKEKADRCG